MTSRSSVLVFLMCVFALVAAAHTRQRVKPASSYFNTRCRRSNQQEFNLCVKKTIMELKPLFKKGIPALGLVSLDPLIIPKMELNQGSGNFGLKTTLTDFVINGLIDFTLKNANFVFADKEVTLDLYLAIPQLTTTAKYSIDGQVLIIPIHGSGDCEMNFTDVTTVVKTRGRVVRRDDQDHVDMTEVTWDISLKSSRSWFYNLFNGDQRLGDATNRFLNDNDQDAFQAIKHLPEEAFAQVLKDILSKIFDTFSVNELFLD